MPPKSALLQGTEPSKPPTYTEPFPPITTEQKIRKAAADKAKKEKSTPREAPSKPKPRSLPPPGEALLAAKNKVKKSPKREKPISTRGKIAAAQAKKWAMNPEAAAKKQKAAERAVADANVVKPAAEGGNAAAKPKKQPKVKPPGTVAIVHAQDATTLSFQKRARKCNEVMYRRTKKAERFAKERGQKALTADPETRKLWTSTPVKTFVKKYRGDIDGAKEELGRNKLLREKMAKLMIAGVLPAPGELELSAVDLYGEAAMFKFMDLPKEVRLIVYEFAVIEEKVFIRPDSPTGQEQPAFAMVSRQIRAEVLPIFYGQNVFGIDIRPNSSLVRTMPNTIQHRMKTPVMPMIERWAKVLESGNHFRHIRDWVLDYETIGSWSEDDDASVLVSIHFKRQENGSYGGGVEIHQEASCVLPRMPGHGTCIIQSSPQWINDLVIDVCNQAAGGYVTADMVVQLAKAVRGKVHTLAESRCDLAGSSQRSRNEESMTRFLLDRF